MPLSDRQSESLAGSEAFLSHQYQLGLLAKCFASRTQRCYHGAPEVSPGSPESFENAIVPLLLCILDLAGSGELPLNFS